MPGPAAKMPRPAFAHFYHGFDHFLYRPHAFEVGEISTGLRLTSRLHHTSYISSISYFYRSIFPTMASKKGATQRVQSQINRMEEEIEWIDTNLPLKLYRAQIHEGKNS
jgi:hypothetical protein